MSSRFFRSRKGFTILEMAIVMLISGLITASLFRAYGQYNRDRMAHESYEKVKSIESSLALYSSFSKRLPCPANATIPFSDPGSGQEISAATCTYLKDDTTPVGTCQEGVCKAWGRDTDADITGLPDPILIGAVPYAAIRQGSDPVSTTLKSMNYKDSLDPWNFKITYAVSGYLTDPATYSSSHGAISVQTENGISLVTPPGSALYVLVAHGDNHMGAYTAYGGAAPTFPCTAGTVDFNNCDMDGTYVSSLRSTNKTGAGAASYFDDTVLYSAFTISSLWDFVSPSSPDIYNKNPGFVGIGTNNPTQMLEVGNGTGTNYDVKATSVIGNNLCSQIGTACWSPDLLSAPKASGLALGCDPLPPVLPGLVRVVTGIGLDASVPPKPKAICADIPMILPGVAQSCAVAGEFVQAFDSAGHIVCGPP